MDNEMEIDKRKIVNLASLMEGGFGYSHSQVIAGLLGSKQKLMIAAPPKSCKTSLAANLAVSVGKGGEWLGYKCNVGDVLYINADATDEALYQRFIDVCPSNEIQRVDILSFKNGYRHDSMDDLANTILGAIGDRKYSLVIIDSLDYFVSFESAGKGLTFGGTFNQLLDLIAHQTEASIIFTLKSEYSYVFEGFCDTYVKLVPVTLERLEATGIEYGNYYQVDIKSSVYASPKPSLFKFEYPTARKSKKVLPASSKLIEQSNDRRQAANLERKEAANKKFEKAFDELATDNCVDISTIAKHLGVEKRTIYRRIEGLPQYEIYDGKVEKTNDTQDGL